MGSIKSTDPYSYFLNPDNYKTYSHEIPVPLDSIKHNFIYQYYADHACPGGTDLEIELCKNYTKAEEIKKNDGINLGINQNMNDVYNEKRNEYLKTFNLSIGIVGVSYLTYINLVKFKFI